MSKLIILRGNSGSGKTRLSKLLQKSLGRGTLVVSQDAVRREMLWVRDGPDTSAVPLLISLLEYGRRNCQAVILEGILNSKWYTQVFEEAVRLFGADIHAYYYDLTFEETLRRHQTRAKKSEFGEQEMRQWFMPRDFMGVIPERIITADCSLDRALGLILSDLGVRNLNQADGPCSR